MKLCFSLNHDTLLTIKKSRESSVATFEIFVSSLSSHSYPLLKSSSSSSLVGLASLTSVFLSPLFSSIKSSLFFQYFYSTVHWTLNEIVGLGVLFFLKENNVLRVAFTCIKVFFMDSVSNAIFLCDSQLNHHSINRRSDINFIISSDLIW